MRDGANFEREPGRPQIVDAGFGAQSASVHNRRLQLGECPLTVGLPERYEAHSGVHQVHGVVVQEGVYSEAKRDSFLRRAGADDDRNGRRHPK